ncbi:CXXC-type zinc finger protein 1 [Liparis tanakae]|uniref:CXXC-type zinc finger protein 1 n=1 Tax=Liparis tanakae TaxID=230148 RepID=A0A4Z2H0C2_9TELE|nr:CXXC-type zinc finger protein 1 [Liparis tanakae]
METSTIHQMEAQRRSPNSGRSLDNGRSLNSGRSPNRAAAQLVAGTHDPDQGLTGLGGSPRPRLMGSHVSEEEAAGAERGPEEEAGGREGGGGGGLKVSMETPRGCDSCSEWFHGSCVGVSEKAAKSIRVWFCPSCRDKDPSLEIRFRLKKPKQEPEWQTEDGPDGDGSSQPTADRRRGSQVTGRFIGPGRELSGSQLLGT